VAVSWPVLLRRGGGWIVAAVAVAVVVLALAAEPPPLRQVTSDPADGAVVDVPPASVRVGFTGLVHPAESHLTVTRRADGATVSQAAATLDGQTLTVPVGLDRPGDYLLGYHVRLADGSQVSGVSRFRVTGTGPARGTVPATGPAGAHAHGADDPVSRGLLVLDLLLIAGAVTILLRPARMRGRHRP
jgi:methionine-rich copper-binding protein CopC